MNDKNQLDILKIADSPYKKSIEDFINHITIKEILIHAAFNINIATLLATLLLGFGLGINSVITYIAFAYGLLLIATSIKVLIKNKPQLMRRFPIFECLDDFVFLVAIPIAFITEQSNDILLVIYFVLGSLFVTSFFSIKYLHNYLYTKLFVFLFFSYFVLQSPNANLNFVITLFPLATICILLVCLACWIYIRQIRLYHLNASYIELYKKAEKAKKELNQLKSKRDTIIRHIGHDLRQPINAVDYALYNIQSNPLSLMQQTQVANAMSSVRDANLLIDEVLSISLDETMSDLNVKAEPFFVNDLLKTLSKDYVGLAQQNGSKLAVSYSSMMVNSDQKLFARILRNFLINAIIYCNGSAILLGVRRRSKGLDIQVHDQGPGINPAQLNTIFEKYTDAVPQTDRQGLGLGIHIAKYIATLLDAEVSIQSTLGKGTICTLHVPQKLLHYE